MGDFERVIHKLRHRQSDKFRRVDRVCGVDFMEAADSRGERSEAAIPR